MTTLIQTIDVDLPAQAAWQRVREFGQAHRLFAGVLKDCTLEGDSRVVTFANGMVVRERLLGIDEAHRRIAYTASGGRTTHHNASLQVMEAGAARCRVVWTLDFLPDEVAPAIGGLVAAGSAALKKSLEG